MESSTEEKTTKREVAYVNYNIRNPYVLLIDDISRLTKIVDTYEAINIALSKGLDLVEISFDKQQRLPVCKILDYGKWKYMLSKKQKDAKKQARLNAVELKTVQFSITTDDNDKNRLIALAKKFILDGDNVKLAIRFKNKRESLNIEFAKSVLKGIVMQFDGIAQLDLLPTIAGRIFSCTLKPLKKGKQ